MDLKELEERTGTLNDLLECFSAWDEDVRVLGNVKAGDAVNSIKFAKRVLFLFQRGIKAGCSSNTWLDSVIDIVEKKIESIKESNTYRGKVSQGASQSIWFLEDILKEIKASPNNTHETMHRH